MKPIFLIGFMGSGKTTLGEALGRVAGDVSSFLPIGCRYIDLDDCIEQRVGMSVRQFFQERGEREFRRLEAEIIRELGVSDDIIIGCGGGTPCHSGNMDWMNAHGVTVFLDASESVLLRRLLEGQEQRPLLAGFTPDELAAFISAKLRERKRWYGMAQMRLDSDRLESPGEIADTVEEFCRMINRSGIFENFNR